MKGVTWDSRQYLSLWFPNTGRLFTCIKSLWKVSWRQVVSQKCSLQAQRFGSSDVVPRRGLKSVDVHPGGISGPPFRRVKARFGHSVPPWMHEPSPKHASGVLQVFHRLRGGRLASCSGNFKSTLCSRPEGNKRLSSRGRIYRWKCCCRFFFFFWKKLSSTTPE